MLLHDVGPADAAKRALSLSYASAGMRLRLTKRLVSAVLAQEPNATVRRVLELRRAGARASARKLDRLLASVDSDNRRRGTLRFHGSSTGRWSGRGYQRQNLKKPEIKDLGSAVEAILAGDMKRIRKLGAPLSVAGSALPQGKH
jgi:hypothetical protein